MKRKMLFSLFAVICLIMITGCVKIEIKVPGLKNTDNSNTNDNKKTTTNNTKNNKNTDGPSYSASDGKEVLIIDVNSEKDVFKDVYFYDEDNNIIEKENVKVTDNIDVTTLGEYEIKYTICDSNNKCNEETRVAVVKDLTAPVITLNRGNLKIPVGNTYNEYGAEAYDNYDKNLGDIKITSNVDMSKVGVYEVKYSICDSSNNCSEKVRKVTTFIQTTTSKSSSSTSNSKSSTSSTVISGKFTSHPSIEGTAPSTLTLDSGSKTGTIVINKCEGFDTINGTYSVSGSTLTLRLSRAINPGQPSVLVFTIINDSTLQLQTDIMACAPYQYEKFTK